MLKFPSAESKANTKGIVLVLGMLKKNNQSVNDTEAHP